MSLLSTKTKSKFTLRGVKLQPTKKREVIVEPITENETNRENLRNEIKRFEERILSIKREINNIESLIEINTYYSNPETEDFLWIN